jgi:hypothetical protein
MTTRPTNKELQRAINKAAFFTVVYPGAEPFLPDFFRSLEKQSHAEFDLIIGNDGLQDLDLGSYDLNARIVDLDGTPAEIRESGLRFLRSQGYEQVIFGDCDDFFSSNRVEVSLRLLQECEVVVNELDLVDEEGALLQSGYLARRLDEGAVIAADLIGDKNIFGLSNTAVRGSCLQGREIPANLVAVDWFLFASLLEGGAKAIFTSSTKTFYRQHGANTAGLAGNDPRKAIQAVRVKALHYEALAEAGLESYRGAAAAFKSLRQRLLDDDTFRAQYLSFLESRTMEFPFWWECALLPEECT